MMVPLLLLAMLLVLSAFFSGSETALTSASRTVLSDLAAKGDPRAKAATRLVDETERFFATILTGNNLVNVAAVTLGQFVVSRLLLDWPLLSRALEGAFPGANWDALLNATLMTPLLLVFGELVPKAVGRRHADRLAVLLAVPLRFCESLLTPAVWLLSAITKSLTCRLGTRRQARRTVTREDLETFAELAVEHGLLPQSAGSMLQKVFEMSHKPVSAMMVPLVDVVVVPLHATPAEVQALAVRTGFARFPVYQGRHDDIIGIVSLRALIYGEHQRSDLGAHGPIASCIDRRVVFVPEYKPVGEVLHELRSEHMPMAMVVDEHGTVIGMVTLEDLVEEIVGEIHDERDRPKEEIRQTGPDTWECSGRVAIDELAERLGWAVPEGPYETLAGLVLKSAGRIPAAGERVTIGDWRIDVLEVVKRRVVRVRLHRQA